MSASYRKWLKDKLVKLQAIDCYSAGATPETVAKQIGVSHSGNSEAEFQREPVR